MSLPRPLAPRASRLAAVFLASLAACAAPARTGSQAARITTSPSLGMGSALAGAAEGGAAVPISPADPVWGDRHAPVSVVVFGDLECPYTGKILRTVQALKEKYGPADLRIVWKDLPLPFHPQARPAAEAAEAVFQLGRGDAFWRFWDQALAHQVELSSTSLDAWAASSGVDMGAFHQALAAHAAAPKVDADLALAQRLHVEGTPTFFVNGTLVVGAQPLDRFVSVIDAELVTAKAKLVSGIAPDALYTELSRANWKPPAMDAADDDDKEDTRTVWKVAIDGAPVRGRADAPVTVVVFSDFQCPYCKRVEPTLKQVADTYGDRVRFVWRDAPLPFHKRALPAAELAREARAEKGDPGFWAAHDAIFASQPNLKDEDLFAVGQALGLDAARVKSAVSGAKYAAQIEADLDLGADLAVQGTPQLFINGRRVTGAQPFEAIKPIVDDELRHAAELVAKGTAPSALYETMMRAAKVAPIAEVKRVAARPGAPARGPASAPVVIEEFADFQCPFCTRAEGTLSEIAKRYGARVKIVWRNLPFHTHSEEAAEAAMEALHQKGSTGFWAMHDKLFAHQGDHDGDGSGLSRQALDGYARDLGLDVTAFDKALDARAHDAEIKADVDAAEAAHIDGTPAFVVGGYFIPGAQPLSVFRRVIERVLSAGPAEPAEAAPPRAPR